MSQSLPAGFSVHLELESTARAIRTYEVQFVPGLWQTEDYARAVLSARSVSGTSEQIERQITIQMRRQQILDCASPPPPEIWAILDESVIRRVVGGRDVMRGQLARLRDLCPCCRPKAQKSKPWRDWRLMAAFILCRNLSCTMAERSAAFVRPAC